MASRKKGGHQIVMVRSHDDKEDGGREMKPILAIPPKDVRELFKRMGLAPKKRMRREP
jgi:hypothetical protein